MNQNNVNKNIQKVLANKSFFLIIIVFVVFLIIAIILYGDYSSKTFNYKNQNEKKLQKIDRIIVYSKSKDEIEKFLSSLPKPLSSDELVNLVDDYAIQNHIDILNVVAKQSQKYEKYISMEIHMAAKVQNFKDLVSFFYLIENSPYLFKLDAWSGRTGDSSTGIIDCDINIIATQIKI
jgi:hypothetical protein